MQAEGDLVDKVWIPDKKEVWKAADVVSYDEEKDLLEVLVSNELKTVKKKKALSYDPSHSDQNLSVCNNAYSLPDLNEAVLLRLLQIRASPKIPQIYTNTGDILLAVNPYLSIPHLYEMPEADAKKTIKDTLKEMQANIGPHVHNLATRAYQNLYESGLRGMSQSILINGESGSGKTESAKKIMEFLLYVSQRKRNEGLTAKPAGKGKKKKKNMRGSINRLRKMVFRTNAQNSTTAAGQKNKPVKAGKVEKLIMQSNPLLEAVGNARTVRNDNSSRFGKFVQLEYDQNGVIVGAKTRHFLLEKSRIVSQARGERNYHIFYQLLAAINEGGMDEGFEELEMMKGKTFKDFKYLFWDHPLNEGEKSKSEVTKKEAADFGRAEKRLLDNIKEIRKADAEEFLHTKKALNDIKIPLDDQKNIWKVLVSILHLGNLDFGWDAKREVTVLKNLDQMEVCAELLGVEPNLFEKTLTRKIMHVHNRASIQEIPLSVAEVVNNRDGLAKAMYEALFEWMLYKINIATRSAMKAVELQQQRAEAGKAGKKKKKDAKMPENHELFIGILDIFGFEMLEKNSFEQLCINWANETLQNMFDKHIWNIEQEQYQDEGISTEALKLKFRDNTQLLKMVNDNQAKTGMFQILDENGVLKNGTDKKFLTAVSTRFKNVMVNVHDLTFKVQHFAGLVNYSAKGMVTKNADHLQQDLADLIALGGMPVEEKELANPKEEKRMLKAPKTFFPVMQRTYIADDNVSEDIEPEATNSFEFLQAIFKLRNELSKGVAEEEEEEDEPAEAGFNMLLGRPKPKKKASRARSRAKKNAKLQSVSWKFSKQMQSLQSLLSSTEQHFIRCLKPNEHKLPPSELWEPDKVNLQLRMLGALEMVRIRRDGFPIRSTPGQLLDKFKLIVNKKSLEEEGEGVLSRQNSGLIAEVQERQKAVAFLNIVLPGGKGKFWHMGENKIFMKEHEFRKVENMERALREESEAKEARLKRLKEAQELAAKKQGAQILIATNYRMYIGRKKFLKQKNGITKLQANARRKAVPSLYDYRFKVIAIQRVLRGWLVRAKYAKLEPIAAKINPIAKGFILRKKIQKIKNTNEFYSRYLRSGEVVVLESLCQSFRKMKQAASATMMKTYSLVLTSGCFIDGVAAEPQLLYINRLTGKLHTRLNYDDRTLCALMASEYKLHIYAPATDPSESDRKMFHFTFLKPIAALWVLALRETHSISSLLELAPPSGQDEEVTEHDGMLPFDTSTPWIFGGPGVLKGDLGSSAHGVSTLTQLGKWRSRHLVVKGTSLFWFETNGKYPVGGLNISTETLINNSRPGDLFNEDYTAKCTLDIESRLLRWPLRLNYDTPKKRQKWVIRLKGLVTRQKQVSSLRLSLRQGVLDAKGMQQLENEIADVDEELDSDIDMQGDSDDGVAPVEEMEDIEQF